MLKKLNILVNDMGKLKTTGWAIIRKENSKLYTKIIFTTKSEAQAYNGYREENKIIKVEIKQSPN